MIIVSDTSAIINLAAINLLRILPELFFEIIIPRPVFDEITVAGVNMPGAEEVKLATWIKVMECKK